MSIDIQSADENLPKPEKRAKSYVIEYATDPERKATRARSTVTAKVIPHESNRDHARGYASYLMAQHELTWTTRNGKLRSLHQVFTFIDEDMFSLISTDTPEHRSKLRELYTTIRTDPITYGPNQGKIRQFRVINFYTTALYNWVESVHPDFECPTWIKKCFPRAPTDTAQPIKRHVLLNPEEANALIYCAYDGFDRAETILRNQMMLSCLVYEGFRPGEIYSLPVADMHALDPVGGDSILSKTGQYVARIPHPSSKTGYRENYLTVANPFVHKYMRYIDSLKNKPHYLCCHISKHIVGDATYLDQLTNTQFKKVCAIAGQHCEAINSDIKKTRPYDLRKAAITFMIDSGMPRHMVEKKCGHTPNSPVIARYYPGASANDYARFKAEALGQEAPTEAPPSMGDWLKNCPACKSETAGGVFTLCIHCGSPVDVPEAPTDEAKLILDMVRHTQQLVMGNADTSELTEEKINHTLMRFNR